MACGSCGGRKRASETEFEVKTDKKTYRVGTLAEAKIRIALDGGGSYKEVAKK